MKLPLLVAARPKFSRGGPKISLGEGRWHIIADRIVDSTLRILVGGEPLSPPLDRTDGYVVTGPCEVAIEFIDRGSEDYVNVHAEKVA